MVGLASPAAPEGVANWWPLLLTAALGAFAGDKRAVSVILAARFIPVGRVAVNLGAGAAGYLRKSFAAITAFSSLMWAGYTVGIRAVAGTWIVDNPLLGAGAACVAAVVAGLALDRCVRTARSRRGGPEVLPMARRRPHA